MRGSELAKQNERRSKQSTHSSQAEVGMYVQAVTTGSTTTSPGAMTPDSFVGILSSEKSRGGLESEEESLDPFFFEDFVVVSDDLPFGSFLREGVPLSLGGGVLLGGGVPLGVGVLLGGGVLLGEGVPLELLGAGDFLGDGVGVAEGDGLGKGDWDGSSLVVVSSPCCPVDWLVTNPSLSICILPPAKYCFRSSSLVI
jgi:hypothetical protein